LARRNARSERETAARVPDAVPTSPAAQVPSRDVASPGPPAEIALALESWFISAARELPWRTTPRDPYRALVSEAMLQQTQVSRVIPAFNRFIETFPDVTSLAHAEESRVLALWSGLGYYRRAKNLHRAAKGVVERFGGRVPSSLDDLLSLPGVGRYTAGAIASIAHAQPAPIVDGNVKRVLLRLHGQDVEPDAPTTVRWTWDEATKLVNAAHRPGVFNEALMELGATVCLAPPARPRCEHCPLARHCQSAQGLWQTIPRPKQLRAPTDLYCVSVFARDRRGRVLIEQRPNTGMWASMWQLPTLETLDEFPSIDALHTFAQMRSLTLMLASRTPITESDDSPMRFTHKTTHRTVYFQVVLATPVVCMRKAAARQWVEPGDLASIGISNAQRRAIALGLAPPTEKP